MRHNPGDWKVSVWSHADGDTVEDASRVKIRVSEATYDLDYAEEIAHTILDFVKQQRDYVAKLKKAN